MHNKSNKADGFKIEKIKRKNIRQFEQGYSVEPKGFEMNQSKGTFLKNQNFLQICRSSLAPGCFRVAVGRRRVLSFSNFSFCFWLTLVLHT